MKQDIPDTTFSNLSVVIQGVLDNYTKICIDSVAQNFPGAEIIFSTNTEDWYVGEKVKIVKCGDPGVFKHNLNKNIKRHIVTSHNGIKHATNNLVLKIRSDLCFINNNIVHNWFGKLDEFTGMPDNPHKVFQTPVGTFEYYTLDPLGEYKLPYHTSDWLMIGHKHDLLTYYQNAYHILGMTEQDISRFRPEQWLNFCSIKPENWHSLHETDNNPDAVEATYKYFGTNFIFHDFARNGIYSQKYINTGTFTLHSTMSSTKWAEKCNWRTW